MTTDWWKSRLLTSEELSEVLGALNSRAEVKLRGHLEVMAADNAALVDMLRLAQADLCTAYGLPRESATGPIPEMLSRPHPGEALHAELERLRKKATSESALVFALAAEHINEDPVRSKKRPLTGRSLMAYERTQQALCDAWKYPEGTPVNVRKDDKSVVQTRTGSMPWMVGGTAVILVDGISGGYALERVNPVSP